MVDVVRSARINVEVEGLEQLSALAAAFDSIRASAGDTVRPTTAAGGENKVVAAAASAGTSIGGQLGTIFESIRTPAEFVKNVATGAVSEIANFLGPLARMGVEIGKVAAASSLPALALVMVSVGPALFNLAATIKILRSSFGWAEDAADEQMQITARTRRRFPGLVGEAFQAAQSTTKDKFDLAAALMGEQAVDSLETRITRQFTEYRMGKGLRGEKDIFARYGITPEFVQQYQQETGGERLTLTDWLAIFIRKREELAAQLEATPAESPERAEAQRRMGQLADDSLKLFNTKFSDVIMTWSSQDVARLGERMAAASPLGEVEGADRNAREFIVALRSTQTIFDQLKRGIAGDVQPALTGMMETIRVAMLPVAEGGQGLGTSLRDLGAALGKHAWETMQLLISEIDITSVTSLLDSFKGWDPSSTVTALTQVIPFIQGVAGVVQAIARFVGILNKTPQELLNMLLGRGGGPPEGAQAFWGERAAWGTAAGVPAGGGGAWGGGGPAGAAMLPPEVGGGPGYRPSVGTTFRPGVRSTTQYLGDTPGGAAGIAAGGGNSGGAGATQAWTIPPSGAGMPAAGAAPYRQYEAGTRYGRAFTPEGLIIHHTAGRGTEAGVAATLRQRGLGIHYVIDRDGNIVQMSPEGRQVSHALTNRQKSMAASGRYLGNWNMEGVEVIALNENDVTPRQRAAIAQLTQERSQRWGWDPRTGVWGHGELATHKEATEGSTARMIREGTIPLPGGGQAVSAVAAAPIGATPAPTPAPAPTSAPTPVQAGRVIPAQMQTPEVMNALREVGAKHGIDPMAIAGVITTESAWKTGAVTGRYRGLTQIGPENPEWANIGRMSAADQIRTYGRWLDRYNFGQKLQNANIDFSRLTPAQQAAYLQGFQFAPNATAWQLAAGQGRGDVRTTATKQARVLGTTTLNEMTRYYEALMGAGQVAGIRPVANTPTTTDLVQPAPGEEAVRLPDGNIAIMPTSGVVTSAMGMRRHPITGRISTHAGVDIAKNAGNSIVSTGGGKVLRAGWVRGYGNFVEIQRPDGSTERYGHMARLPDVVAGQQVERGQQIGLVGSTGMSTGPHLHYERRDAQGRPIDINKEIGAVGTRIAGGVQRITAQPPLEVAAKAVEPAPETEEEAERLRAGAPRPDVTARNRDLLTRKSTEDASEERAARRDADRKALEEKPRSKEDEAIKQGSAAGKAAADKFKEEVKDVKIPVKLPSDGDKERDKGSEEPEKKAA